jgi:hypothetical protein
MRTCFLSSQMNAIGGFSARLNGFRRGHPPKMRRNEKQEQGNGMSGAHSMTDVENLSQTETRDRSLAMTLGRPLVSPGLAGCHVPADRRQRIHTPFLSQRGRSAKELSVSMNDDRSPLLDLMNCIVCDQTMKLEKIDPDDGGNDVIQYRSKLCGRIERLRLFRRSRE